MHKSCIFNLLHMVHHKREKIGKNKIKFDAPNHPRQFKLIVAESLSTKS